MNAEGLRALLLARAVEEGDAEGQLVSVAERRRLTREARAGSGGEGSFLLRRSHLLLAELAEREPRLGRAWRADLLLAPAPWLPLAAAFVLGAAVDRIGGGRRVYVLFSPVLGLLVWNVLVYAYLALGVWRRGRAGREGDPADEEPGQPLLLRVSGWLRERIGGAPWASASIARGGAAASLSGAIWARFLGDWWHASRPLQLARLRLALHAGALGFALGVIVSLYLRGLVWDYHATWESTFLGPEAVHRILSVVLFPAAFVLGTQVPGPEHLTAIRAEPESAARWIHLWALNAALLVVLPRALLALVSARRARALGAALPFDWAADPYALRLSAPERGAGLAADVQPYSYRPSTRVRELLGELLLELLGDRARVRWREPLAYGEEPPSEPPPSAERAPTCRVLLFNLAQSPEEEVHGRLVESARRAVESAPGGAFLLVCADEAPYLERMGQGVEAEQRVEERRRSWRRVVRDAGLRVVFLRLERPDADRDLAALRGGLFPERALEVAG